MIVVDIDLRSAVTGQRSTLNTLIVDNIGGTGSKGNYRCRMYRKGERARYHNDWEMAGHAKPIREARVEGHSRLAEPVGNLIAKALTALGYG